MNDQVKKEKKRDIIALIIVSVIAVIIGIFSIKAYIEAPRDLGSDLVYVGKQDYGNIFGFDQLPGSTYYFATNMSKADLELHINKTSFEYAGETGGAASVDYKYSGLAFTPDNAADEALKKNRFVVYYFDEQNTKSALSVIELKQTGKKYLIAIDSKYYPVLHQALSQAHLIK